MFGRPDGHTTPEADELAALLARRAGGADGSSETDGSGGPPAGAGDRGEASEASAAAEASDTDVAAGPDAPRPRTRLIALLAAAVVMVGGALVVPALAESSSPSALALLRSPRQTGELVPVGLPDDAARSARYLDTALGYRFWLARTGEGALCLVALRENWAGVGTACTDADDFRANGLAIGVLARSILPAVRPAGIDDGGGVVFTLSARATEVSWAQASADELAQVVMLRPERRTETVRVWVEAGE